jgi:hypothetical protein
MNFPKSQTILHFLKDKEENAQSALCTITEK